MISMPGDGIEESETLKHGPPGRAAGRRGGQMKIRDMGEFQFIRSIAEGCHFSTQDLIRGIGDDCAVIGPYGERVLLVTTDQLLEGVHFLGGHVPHEQLGQKAVAVNLSDVAAMGGEPRHLFLSLAIPENSRVEELHAFYRGVKAMCRHYGVNLLGGDTSRSLGGLLINVTVIGQGLEEEILYRDGARPGDRIYVTGTLGDSAGGLRLHTGRWQAEEPEASFLKAAHHRPVPFVEAGRFIARSRAATAMIDLSDGVASDLGHVCEASGVGARILYDNLPVSDELRKIAEANGEDAKSLALRGGEDYRLLFTVPLERAQDFQVRFEREGPCEIFLIGTVTEEPGIRVVRKGGEEEPLSARGFDHFG
ncbi:MAG: thiamine-phosphate kinase [Deltaproteobacteria bacterium]|nr:MAG: thiamine-phosphate kinase [Deltaproteobacteria bacterium]